MTLLGLCSIAFCGCQVLQSMGKCRNTMAQSFVPLLAVAGRCCRAQPLINIEGATKRKHGMTRHVRSCAASAFWKSIHMFTNEMRHTCMPGGSAILKIMMGMLETALQIPRLNGRASVGDRCLPKGSPVPRSRIGIKIVVAIAVIISVQCLYHHPHPRPLSPNIIIIIIVIIILIIIKRKKKHTQTHTHTRPRARTTRRHPQPHTRRDTHTATHTHSHTHAADTQGERQGEVSPGRIEVRPTGRVGGKFRLAGGLLHGRRCWWLAGGWFQQCVLASSHRGRVYVGCSQPRSSDSWFERTGRCAHWYARTTATRSRQLRVIETIAGGSSHPCSAEQICGSDTFHPTKDAKSRFCVGRLAVGRWWSTGVSVTESSCNEAGFFLHGGGYASRDVTLFGCYPECTVGDLRLFLGMRHPHDLVDFFQCSERLR